MSLPDLNLDSRSFQNIVDETKRKIAQRCPEWTEHNVSDPGVTLIELFAGMVEMMLFRLNQVPEKNYRKFLELIGISLEPPAAAGTTLLFRLARPLSDAADEASLPGLAPYYTTVSTLRTEVDEAIEFVTTQAVDFRAPSLRWILSIPGDLEPRSDLGQRAEKYDLEKFGKELGADFVAAEERQSQTADELFKKVSPEFFPVFQARPQPGDAIYFGFDGEVPGHLIRIEADGLPGAATNIIPEAPLQVWEVFDSAQAEWVPAHVLEDQSMGFTRASGFVDVLLPRAISKFRIGGDEAYWVRCRYTEVREELPYYQTHKEDIISYLRSPRLRMVTAQTRGASALALNCTPIFSEDVGESNGLPGQTFRLSYGPILKLDEHERVIRTVSPDQEEETEVSEFTMVDDFSASGPQDRHFMFDPLTGQISFGPVVLSPDGSARQYGSIPPKGHRIVFPRYRIGGGAAGNVRPGLVGHLKSAVPGISEVSNIRQGEGGTNRETLDHAKMRALDKLKVQNRAVTAEDFAYLAKRALDGTSRENAVGRAHCLSAELGSAAQENVVVPGSVKVLLVPFLPRDVLTPEPGELQIAEDVSRLVEAFLDERKLLTTQLEIGVPDYLYLSTEIQIIANSKADPIVVGKQVEARLSAYFHPLFGGPAGTGWPFGQRVKASDIYAVVADVPGVGFLHECHAYTSSVMGDGSTTPVLVDLREGIALRPDQVIVSRNHTVKVRSAWEVREELSIGS